MLCDRGFPTLGSPMEHFDLACLYWIYCVEFSIWYDKDLSSFGFTDSMSIANQTKQLNAEMSQLKFPAHMQR